QEAWWGLLAVAELAGEPWARRAREAALALHGGGADVEPDRGVLLLRALREIFAEAGTDRLSTLEVLRRLVEREQEPWPRWWGEAVEAALDRGRPPRRAGAELAARLKPFGISPRVVKMPDGTTARGYARADLEEAWRVYLSRGEGTVNPCAGGDVTDVTDVTALTSEVTSVASVTSGGEAGSPDAGTSNGRGPSLDRGSPRTAGALSAGDVLALARGLGWPALTRSDGSVVETPGSWEALIRGSDAAALRGLWDHLEGVEAAGAALAAEPTAPAAPGEASTRAAVLEAARSRGWPRVRIGPVTIAGGEDGWRTALRHAPRSRLRRLGAALDGRAAPERCPHCDARSREPGYWGHGMRCLLRRPEGARAAGGR
ncbi:MAG TPA: DUF3631 domain-containing protein, partial [Actinomycetota bacterium]|nr:DUF3631 domain-containing protein [Actinomycetota bacterium]